MTKKYCVIYFVTEKAEGTFYEPFAVTEKVEIAKDFCEKNKRFEFEIKEIESDETSAVEILNKHKSLNLNLLSDYDISEYEEYVEDTYGTTDLLTYEEFVILKEWQDE